MFLVESRFFISFKHSRMSEFMLSFRWKLCYLFCTPGSGDISASCASGYGDFWVGNSSSSSVSDDSPSSDMESLFSYSSMTVFKGLARVNDFSPENSTPCRGISSCSSLLVCFEILNFFPNDSYFVSCLMGLVSLFVSWESSLTTSKEAWFWSNELCLILLIIWLACVGTLAVCLITGCFFFPCLV